MLVIGRTQRRTHTHTHMCALKAKVEHSAVSKQFDYIETFEIFGKPRPRPLKRIKPHTWHGMVVEYTSETILFIECVYGAVHAYMYGKGTA